jgi:hypothetical protein
MNFRYRINQLRNSLSGQSKSGRINNWVFIYGVPRSGTTYVLQEFMKLSKRGIGDWELKCLLPGMDEIAKSGWIDFNLDRFSQDISRNVLDFSPPGGGNVFDITVKQIRTNKAEYELYTSMFGCEPQIRIFLFREPDSWMPSAIKKYGISEEECASLYKESLEAYDSIGGYVIEYNNNLPAKLQLLPCFSGKAIGEFNEPKRQYGRASESIWTLYEEFRKRHSAE